MPAATTPPSPDGASIDGALLPAAGQAEIAALRLEISHLRTALESRAAIDQACGVLVACYRISPHSAFQLMVRWSQRRNVKLRIIAETLLAIVELGSDRTDIDVDVASWLTDQFAGTALFATPTGPPDPAAG